MQAKPNSITNDCQHLIICDIKVSLVDTHCRPLDSDLLCARTKLKPYTSQSHIPGSSDSTFCKGKKFIQFLSYQSPNFCDFHPPLTHYMAVPNEAGHRPVLDFDTSVLVNSSMVRPVSPSENGSRSSFSSVRENDDGLAQTFTRSKVSSYIEAPEDVFDESPTTEIAQLSFQAPLTQPHSKLHGFWFPPDSFKGWKEIPIKGKPASRSCEDLRKLSMTWESAPATPPPVRKPAGVYGIGNSPLERLPSEVLGTYRHEIIAPPPFLLLRGFFFSLIAPLHNIKKMPWLTR